MPDDTTIAVEEHIVTASYLETAHRLAVLPGDRTEVELTRTAEATEPLRSQLLDLDARIAEMDAVGQDLAVLSLNPPGVQPFSPAAASDLAHEFNGALATIVADRPARFAGLGAIAPQDPGSAADEIARVMGPLALSGIMINSHTGDHYLDEPQFAPLLAAAEAHGAPLYLHPRVPSMRGPYLDHGMSGAVWGYQAEAGLHAMRLVLSGTFDRYPNLTVVLGHLGEGIPFWMRRIDNRHAFAARVPGAATAMPRLELTPSEYVRRNVVVTTSGIDDPEVLGLVLTKLGSDHVMFAIDAPYEDTAETMTALRNAGLTDDQFADVSHRTAERVFSLNR